MRWAALALGLMACGSSSTGLDGGARDLAVMGDLPAVADASCAATTAPETLYLAPCTTAASGFCLFAQPSTDFF